MEYKKYCDGNERNTPVLELFIQIKRRLVKIFLAFIFVSPCTIESVMGQQRNNGKLKVSENKHFLVLVMDEASRKYPQPGKGGAFY